MMFGIVPDTKWRLTGRIKSSRRERLLDTSFSSIVQKISAEAQLNDHKCCSIRDYVGAKRAQIKLDLPCETVDLFHNGASGYRAQYYLRTEHGKAADRYLIDSLLPWLKCACAAQPKRDCCWEFIKASLCHSDAKIWIHEGAWLSDNRDTDRNLIVERWERNAHAITLRHRFEASWAHLTPDTETQLELKGGCIDETFEPIDVLLKPHRSQELHDHGYT